MKRRRNAVESYGELTHSGRARVESPPPIESNKRAMLHPLRLVISLSRPKSRYNEPES